MSCDSDEAFGSNANNDAKSNEIFRYTHEELVDLFKFFPEPPDKLSECWEIISPNGPLAPVSKLPLSDLEKISYYKGINSYQALLEKWGKAQRGRGWGRARRGRGWNNDRRNPGPTFFNGIGPPGKWDPNWNSGAYRPRRNGSNDNLQVPARREWVRGRVWVRGGGRGGRGMGGQRSPTELSASPPDGRTSPFEPPEQLGRDHDVEEIWEEDDWDLELIGDTPEEESHDEEWSRILSHASLYDLREPAIGGANSPAAWSECPASSEASPPRTLSLDPPVLQRLVRLQLQRSPSQSNIDPDLLQEMVENVLTQIPITQGSDLKSPITPSQAAELTEEKRKLEERLREQNNLLREHKNRLRSKEEELEAIRRRQLRAWDNGPPHRRNRPKSLVEIQWEQAAEEGFPVACYRPISWVERVSGAAGGTPGSFPQRRQCDSLSNASSTLSLTEKSGPLVRHSSMDVINQRVDQPGAWTQRKGRRRRVFRRVDPHTLNGLLTTTP